jgi:hypothetical protein
MELLFNSLQIFCIEALQFFFQTIQNSPMKITCRNAICLLCNMLLIAGKFLEMLIRLNKK